MLIDTHLHLMDYDCNISDVIYRAKCAGVCYLVVSGSDLIDNRFNFELLDKFDNVFLSVGFHPSCSSVVGDSDFAFLEECLSNDRVVAIGEIGLDYHYGKGDRDLQIVLFRRQLDLAVKYNKPVVIHTRDAFFDTYSILREYDLKGVIHCFSGSVEVARKYLSLGYYLGIGGVVTFKNSNLKDVLREIGLDRVVFETDSPYLSPYRGKVNEPCNVSYICDFVSDYLNIDYDDVCLVTSGNACCLFDLKGIL